MDFVVQAVVDAQFSQTVRNRSLKSACPFRQADMIVAAMHHQQRNAPVWRIMEQVDTRRFHFGEHTWSAIGLYERIAFIGGDYRRIVCQLPMRHTVFHLQRRHHAA